MVGGALFAEALNVLAQSGFQATGFSRVWAGPAWPDPSDPAFYNAVVEGGWRGTPPQLLALLLEVEAAFGRRRGVKNAPRTLDLDLLDFEGGRGRFEPDLEVPHPRLSVRPFILGPLADASPDWRHPDIGKSARGLYEAAENKEEYRPVTEMPLQLAEITANP